jgi:hypothetical protein
MNDNNFLELQMTEGIRKIFLKNIESYKKGLKRKELVSYPFFYDFVGKNMN